MFTEAFWFVCIYHTARVVLPSHVSFVLPACPSCLPCLSSSTCLTPSETAAACRAVEASHWRYREFAETAHVPLDQVARPPTIKLLLVQRIADLVAVTLQCRQDVRINGMIHMPTYFRSGAPLIRAVH